jgi:hypothetical protein
MKRSKPFYFFFIALLLTASTNILWAGTGTISGKIYDDVSFNISISNVNISILNISTHEPLTTVRNQQDGTYTVKIPEGTYIVYAIPEETSLYVPKYFGGVYYIGFAKRISVSSGQDVTVNIGLSTGGQISGVVYEDVYPYATISSLTVICYDYYTDEFVSLAWTNTMGAYQIDLPVGDYKIFAQAQNNSIYISEYYEDTFDSFYAKKTNISAGQTLKNIDFGLAIGGVISGSVLDFEELTAIAFMRIEAYDMNGVLQGYTTSLDDGTYFLHVPEGSYKLRAYDTENRNYVTVFYERTFDFRNAVIIDVEKGYGTGNKNFILLKGIKVVGIVTGVNQAPLVNVIVWALATSGNNQHWAKTLSDGSYEIILPEASYLFYAECSDFLPQYYQYATDPEDATIVNVDHNLSGIDFQLGIENEDQYQLKDLVTMLQLLSGVMINQQAISVSYFDQNMNNHVDMADVLHIMLNFVE